MGGGARFALGILTGVAGVILVAAAAGFIVVYTGAYDVAATDRHVPFVRWAFETTMRNSVESRALELSPRPADAEVSMEDAGRLYGHACVHCHGGPGVERAHWATEMLPMPPELTHAATEWSAPEIFWIVKHGIKMSGMPPFGPHESDETLWSVAAFVERLPAMTAEEFARWTEAAPAGGEPSHTE